MVIDTILIKIMFYSWGGIEAATVGGFFERKNRQFTDSQHYQCQIVKILAVYIILLFCFMLFVV